MCNKFKFTFIKAKAVSRMHIFSDRKLMVDYNRGVLLNDAEDVDLKYNRNMSTI